MGQQRPQLAKPTLDKDLDKISSVEDATRQVSRRLAGPGACLLFLLVVVILAGIYTLGQPGFLIIAAASVLAAYMAINIGANDVTNNIGAAVGARAMTLATGLAIAAVFEVAGAVIAGRGVAETVASAILHAGTIDNPQILVWAMMAALLAAAIWINLATWFGAPVSTTHAVVGGVMGAGIAAAGLSAVNWPLIAGISLSWMLSPLLGGLIAAAFLAFIKEFIIYREDKIAAAKTWVPVLIGVMTGSFIAYLMLVGLGQLVDVSVAAATLLGLASGLLAWRASVPLLRRQAENLENRNQSLRILFRIPLVCSAALLSFAHGANDVSNAIGPLAAIVAALQASPGTGATISLWELVIGGCGISLGLLLFGPKLIRLVGKEITRLNPMRAYCVVLSAALTVIVASWFGIPVSSTHIAVGSVFGVGFFREWYTRHSRRRLEYVRSRAARFDATWPAERNDAEMRRRLLVRRSHFMSIVAAWVVTLPAAALLAAAIASVMFALFV